jgi:hypothetical protein
MSTFHSFLHPPIYRRLCTITPKTQQILIKHNKYYHIIPSAFKDDDPPINLLPPLSPQRDTAVSPSRAAAIISGIGSTMAGVIGALSPNCAAPLFLIGALPFDQSLVDSSISTAINKNENSSIDDDGDGGEPTAEIVVAILQMAADNKAKEGDGGIRNVKGGEVNLHFEAMMSVNCQLDEHVRNLANNLDIEEWGEVFAMPIPGAPDRWISPGAPITFLCYCLKLDAPAFFANVDNPGQWNGFVFQPKYASEKGRNEEKKQMRYVGLMMPAGAMVVPTNNDGIHEINK